MAATLWMLLLCAPQQAAADTIVVCPQEFRPALTPWLEHRQAQGHRLAVISNRYSAVELRDEIRRIAASGQVKNLLLVGDADPAMMTNSAVRKRSVPTHHAEARVNVQFGSEKEIATDNWYADLDDDHMPDLAVGRLTADTPAELALIVQKIVDYETCEDFGHWRRQVHFVAGLGGFGAVADGVVEAAAKSLITQGIPAAFSTTMTYGSWQSPYCPDPRQFGRVTLGRLNEGSLFWVYMGHGQQRAVDEVHVPGASFPILASSDTAQLACRHGAPIACFLACYSGAFDQPRDCLAEDMLRSPGGPVAIICGTRVTMPYGMAVLGSELLRECFVEHPDTIGEALLVAKRRSIADSNSPQRVALDAVAKALSPAGTDLAAERAEHLELFNLIGDPLLRLPHPRTIEVEVEPTTTAGDELFVAGRSPVAGTCTVELVVRRDRLTFQPARRGEFDPRKLADYSEVYRRANEPRLAGANVRMVEGRFETRISVPSHARGACHVRVFVEGKADCAAGAADVQIEAPAK